MALCSRIPAIPPTAEKVRFYPYGTWLWTATRMGSTAKVAIQVDTAGVHTLNLWMRESGAIVDRILVTPDKNFVPTGDGPAESVQEARP